MRNVVALITKTFGGDSFVAKIFNYLNVFNANEKHILMV